MNGQSYCESEKRQRDEENAYCNSCDYSTSMPRMYNSDLTTLVLSRPTILEEGGQSPIRDQGYGIVEYLLLTEPKVMKFGRTAVLEDFETPPSL